MCFGDGGAAKDAKKARKKAERDQQRRENRITLGQERIDENFAQFDDGYYDSYSDSVFDTLAPQLRDQRDEVHSALVAALAGRGMLESTPGAQQVSKLSGAFADELARARDSGISGAGDLRGRVENQRSNLYALNQASADPQAITTQARGAATSLAVPPPNTSVGRVFDNLLTPLTAYNTAKQYAAPPPTRSPARVASGTGSSRLVGG